MAVKSKDDLLAELKTRFGEDDNSDDTLSFIEDISDTYDDLSEQVSKSGEWKDRYEQNDREWRQKYKERFFSKPSSEDETVTDTDEDEETETKKPMTFEDLFTIERK